MGAQRKRWEESGESFRETGENEKENRVLKVGSEGVSCPTRGPGSFVRAQGKGQDEPGLGSCRNSTWEDKGWCWLG